MKDILKTLVQIPSVSGDYKANNQAIEYIDRFLSERGMFVKRHEFNGVESVVATTRNTKTPEVFLAAHVDVVPAPAEQFNLLEKDGRYYGRGTADMKFAIAAYLQLVDDLNGSLADYDFGIMITSDEEVGGFNGTEALLKEGYVPKVAILPDAGDSPKGWKLERSTKGRMSIEVKTFGKSAHGSRPWKGENAIDKLTLLLEEIKAPFKNQDAKTNTLAVCLIEGGTAYNQIPASASATLDIRTLSDADTENIEQTISAICKKHDAEYVEAFEARCHAINLDRQNYYVKQFIASLQQTIGTLPTEVDSTGSSDARFFAKAGIPCMVITPPNDGYHAPDEWVSIEGLQQLRETLHLYLNGVAKNPARTIARQKQPKVLTVAQ
jgi:succinyl-diaminopimelate desuccinylase